MPDVKEFQQLKAKADRLRAEAERAAGARDAAVAELKDKFSVSTLDEATKLLAELEAEATAAEAEYQRLYDEFQVEWGDKLK